MGVAQTGLALGLGSVGQWQSGLEWGLEAEYQSGLALGLGSAGRYPSSSELEK
jgi:hypothetical protein